MIIPFLKKSNGLYYIVTNISSILFFFGLYFYLGIHEGINNPWYYWLYFSTIIQTTVGYSGIRSRYDIDSQENKETNFTDISILSIKSNFFRFCMVAQLFSIIFIHGYFLNV